jgi:histidyl-tRNA synthetase
MAQGALPGFRDFYPEQFAERAYLMGVWRDVARRFAFVEYDGPPLEALELYTKKSGDEIVGQLYEFEDKGGRRVALRPEMTPTLARMVAAKANALRKPVRWFSVPQLFRYARQQRGRLREHFQLIVDIFGEAGVTADAELLAVAIEIMRELGLSPQDVRARVSDRRLLRALLATLGVSDEQSPAVFDAIDKLGRRPRDITREKLGEAGMSGENIDVLLGLMTDTTPESLEASYATDASVAPHLAELRRYLEQLERLGVRDWVSVDLTIVRGLAYYTGIVFELFDAKGELRAICGGGRYDTLLKSLGGVDLPALGFGMGDVVLGELLRDRGYLQDHATVAQPDFWVATEDESQRGVVPAVATALRRAGASVEYALRDQSLSKQKKASHSAGATYFVTLAPDFPTSHLVTVDAFAETATPTLAELIGASGEGQRPTIERLVETIRANPQILSSTL